MERAGTGGGGHYQQHQHAASQLQQHHAYMTSSTDEQYQHPHQHQHTTKSSFDNPAIKKKPPKLKAINRSLSMAIDNYDLPSGGGSIGSISPKYATMTHVVDDGLIIEQPLIHRAASPVAIRSAPPPQTLAIPTATQHGGGGSGSVSPALSVRQQQYLRTFQHMAAQAARQQHGQQHAHGQHHSSSASSPTSHAVSPVPGGSIGSTSSQHQLSQQQQQHQPDIYLVSSGSFGDEMMGHAVGSSSIRGSGVGGSSSPIQFIDDYMLPPVPQSQSQHRSSHMDAHATHPLKKNMFRRSDTIDVHPASTFQMKKTHSFHAQQDPTALDPSLLSASGTQISSASSSRRTSSVRGNFLMPGHHPAGKDLSRSPSPSRRGCRSHRSFNDPQRRPNIKPESVIESQIRHPSLNDDLVEPATLYSQGNLSLENELFIESRSRSNSHTKMEDVGADIAAAQRAAAALLRKSSGSFEDGGAVQQGAHLPVTATSSLKKRDLPHSRQHSTHSLELDGRPSTSAAAAHTHPPHNLQLHSATAAATAAYHFKRGAQHGRSLYLSPNNLEELQVHHRPTVLAAAAAFQGTNASAKQVKALHSASVRLRTYREALATKKSKSFIGDSAYPPQVGAGMGNEFELTSPHRRNSRPLSSAVGGAGGNATTIDDIKRSPRPLALASTSSAAAAFIEEKRPSFERKQSLTYEIGDAAFEQVLRPFHHKVAGRKSSMSGSHKALKKKSLSDETDENEAADRKRKRIVCLVMTVFLCLVSASVLVVVLTLTHSSSSSSTTHHYHQHHPKKTNAPMRETPVHYNIRQENERLMKETMERARFGKNYTDTAAFIGSGSSAGIGYSSISGVGAAHLIGGNTAGSEHISSSSSNNGGSGGSNGSGGFNSISTSVHLRTNDATALTAAAPGAADTQQLQQKQIP